MKYVDAMIEGAEVPDERPEYDIACGSTGLPSNEINGSSKRGNIPLGALWSVSWVSGTTGAAKARAGF